MIVLTGLLGSPGFLVPGYVPDTAPVYFPVRTRGFVASARRISIIEVEAVQQSVISTTVVGNRRTFTVAARVRPVAKKGAIRARVLNASVSRPAASFTRTCPSP